MFCHFIIHSQFEHDLSHTRANGSPFEEPDSALSDDPTVHRNGPVWSGHDSGSSVLWWGWKLLVLTPAVNMKNTDPVSMGTSNPL